MRIPTASTDPLHPKPLGGRHRLVPGHVRAAQELQRRLAEAMKAGAR